MASTLVVVVLGCVFPVAQASPGTACNCSGCFMLLVPPDEATHVAVADGDWSAASTWDHGVPGTGAKVFVPSGRVVTYDADSAARIATIRIEGELAFDPAVDTRLVVDFIAVIPGGTGNTEAQVTAAHDIGATAYSGTPDFLKTMLERAEALERPLSIARALVSGGPLFASLREDYGRRGIACLQCYATADLGLIAYETHENGMPHPGMVVDEGVIVEILRPGTGDPVPDGEVGEVVVTTLNSDYPLVRFATGDLSSVLPGPSPCGRTNMRIRGWMGRADQTTKVKGMFVRPEQIAAILARHPGVLKGRLTVSREAEQDRMTLTVETAEPSPDLAAAVAETMRDVLKLRGDVEADIPGSLPNDGKVIDDIRKFD